MPYKGAFIGFGNIAELGHTPSYAPSKECQIVAVVESSLARQEAAKKTNASWRLYSTVDELFANESLDYVDICTPPASHAPLALRALENGLHVLCEKPLTLKPQEYQDLAKAARSQDRVLFTVHNWKYAPIFQKTLELLKSGRIGKVWHAEIFTLRHSHCKGAPSAVEDWRKVASVAGGGIIVDHGWHAFYLLLHLVGQEPEKVMAKLLTDPQNPTGLEEAAQVLVQFPEADGYIHLTWRADKRRNSMNVQGTEGTLLLDDDRILITDKQGQQEKICFDSALSEGSHHADWFGPLLNDFAAEIAIPAQRHQNLEEAGWCVALTSGAYASHLQRFKELEVLSPTIQTV